MCANGSGDDGLLTFSTSVVSDPVQVSAKMDVEPEVDSTNSLLMLSQTVRGTIPTAAWKHFTPNCYSHFWSMSMYDLHVPHAEYEGAISRKKKELKHLDKPVEDGIVFAQSSGAVSTKKKMSKKALQIEKEKLKHIIKSLEGEHATHRRHVKQRLGELKKESDRWYLTNKTIPFAQHCLFPRVTTSEVDALFCAQWMESMREIEAKNFNWIRTANLVWDCMASLLCSCSYDQASRFGIFFNQLLAKVLHWRIGNNYRRECASNFCFEGRML